MVLQGMAACPPGIPGETCGAPTWVSDLTRAASEAMSSYPEASVAHCQSAVRQWDRFCEAAGVGREPTPADVVNYVMARVAPPVHTPRIFGGPGAPILASGVKRELAWIQRTRALSGLSNTAFEHESVTRLLTRVGSGYHPTKSGKSPVLFANVRATDPGPAASLEQLRNHALLALGFFLGLRSGELVRICVRDVTFTGPDSLQLMLHADKTNQTILRTQVPRTMLTGGELLVGWMRRYLLAFPEDLRAKGGSLPMFPNLSRRGRAEPLARASVGQIVGRLVPGCTGHSMRVGFCTEAIAAGVAPSDLSEFGRWLSADMIRLYGKRTIDDGVRMAEALTRGGVQRVGPGLLTAPGLRRSASAGAPAAGHPCEARSASVPVEPEGKRTRRL